MKSREVWLILAIRKNKNPAKYNKIFNDLRKLSSTKLNEEMAAICENEDSRKFIPAKMYTLYLGVYMNSGSDVEAETPGVVIKIPKCSHIIAGNTFYFIFSGRSVQMTFQTWTRVNVDKKYFDVIRMVFGHLFFVASFIVLPFVVFRGGIPSPPRVLKSKKAQDELRESYSFSRNQGTQLIRAVAIVVQIKLAGSIHISMSR